MQTVTSPAATGTQTIGVAVSSAIAAGGRLLNHGEGVVVQTAISAGGRYLNHSETLIEGRRG